VLPTVGKKSCMVLLCVAVPAACLTAISCHCSCDVHVSVHTAGWCCACSCTPGHQKHCMRPCFAHPVCAILSWLTITASWLDLQMFFMGNVVRVSRGAECLLMAG
jgi:hypothetical protein